MICLVLNEPTIVRTVTSAKQYASRCDLYELRVDCLDAAEQAAAGAVPAMLAVEGIDAKVILTVRRLSDGGLFQGSEEDRVRLMTQSMIAAAEAGTPFWAVDLEEDFDLPALRELAGSSGTAVIRSICDLARVPADLRERMARAARGNDEILKAAVMVNSTAELLELCRISEEFSDRTHIVLGMGEWGRPSRILAGKLGSLFTCCSIPGSSAASEHLDAEVLDSLYRYRSIHADTALFGVIGNPIAHSRSPEYHNGRFSQDGLDAVYLPIRVDNVADFFELARFLGIRGVSVTIPHKEAVIAHLEHADETVQAVGACNTITWSSGTGEQAAFYGTNTDVTGFLHPLMQRTSRSTLSGMRATVVGAGGAARGIVYGLVSSGVSVCVVNRTAARAAALAASLSAYARDGARLITAGLDTAGAEAAASFADIIVQTTSVGMHPNEGADPFPAYRFSGREVVYDIIYTPERTAFLNRAVASGCTVISGRAMFDEQAAEQYRLFSKLVS